MQFISFFIEVLLKRREARLALNEMKSFSMWFSVSAAVDGIDKISQRGRQLCEMQETISKPRPHVSLAAV